MASELQDSAYQQLAQTQVSTNDLNSPSNLNFMVHLMEKFEEDRLASSETKRICSAIYEINFCRNRAVENLEAEKQYLFASRTRFKHLLALFTVQRPDNPGAPSASLSTTPASLAQEGLGPGIYRMEQRLVRVFRDIEMLQNMHVPSYLPVQPHSRALPLGAHPPPDAVQGSAAGGSSQFDGAGATFEGYSSTYYMEPIPVAQGVYSTVAQAQPEQTPTSGQDFAAWTGGRGFNSSVYHSPTNFMSVGAYLRRRAARG
ncbi:hypothetical protein C8R46DRAFT_1044815 [Mycena filopes]|nr:hypothetical protein C8R46DRAFT_1044815 [Mycena filopes]